MQVCLLVLIGVAAMFMQGNNTWDGLHRLLLLGHLLGIRHLKELPNLTPVINFCSTTQTLNESGILDL